MLLEKLLKLFEKYPNQKKALLILVGYGVWMFFSRLLFLTFITYFMARSSQPRFEEINDVLVAGEIGFLAVLSWSFVAIMRRSTVPGGFEEFWMRFRIKIDFLPGIIRGSALAFSLSLAFVFSDQYRYLGFFLEWEDIFISILPVLIRAASLILLVYCEEFIFRQKLLNTLRKCFSEFEAVLLTSLAYCILKIIQFDINIIQMSAVFWVSMALGFQAILRHEFVWGAGFWSGILLVFHSILSLPLWDNEFSGLFLLQFRGDHEEFNSLLHGGVFGPMAGIVFQMIFVLFTVRGIWKYKKNLMRSPFTR